MHKFYGFIVIILLKITSSPASELANIVNYVEECIGQPYGHKILDPNDCHGYLLCHGNSTIQQYCAPGEKFSNKDHDCISGKCPPCPCEDQTPTTVTSSLPTLSTLPTTSIPWTTSWTPDPSTFDCTPHKHGSRFPNEYHCRWFWQCVEGRAVALFCELGMWYDRDHHVCNFPNNVKNCPAMKD